MTVIVYTLAHTEHAHRSGGGSERWWSVTSEPWSGAVSLGRTQYVSADAAKDLALDHLLSEGLIPVGTGPDAWSAAADSEPSAPVFRLYVGPQGHVLYPRSAPLITEES